MVLIKALDLYVPQIRQCRTVPFNLLPPYPPPPSPTSLSLSYFLIIVLTFQVYKGNHTVIVSYETIIQVGRRERERETEI